MKQLFSFAALAAISVGSVCAQSSMDWSHPSFSVGAGFTSLDGRSSHTLDSGWNVDAGVGVKMSPWLGINANFAYNQMGIKSGTLANDGYPGGDVNVFSATLDPTIHLNPKGHLDFYIMGGGGYFHRTTEYSNPTNNGSALLGNAAAAYTINKPGIDVGAGIAMGTKFHGKVFMEAKWDRIFMDRFGTRDMIPVTFGFRW